MSVAAGVSIVVSVIVLLGSIDHSLSRLVRSFGGPAPLRVVGPTAHGGVDLAAVERIAAVPGVARAVPMVQAPTIAESADGTETAVLVTAFDCRVEALIGAFGCTDELLRGASGSDVPAILSPSLVRRLGPGGVIRTDVGRIPIAGVATNDALDKINGGRLAVFALPVAQRLFDRPARVDAVFVVPTAGTDLALLRGRLQHAVGEPNAVLTDGELPRWMLAGGPLLPLLGLVGLFALGLSALLVYNSIALTLEERRRDLAIIAAVGAPPRLLGGGVLAEAAVLGALGGAVGVVLGVALAHPVVASTNSFLAHSLAVGVRVHVSSSIVIIGVLIGVLTALGAAITPVRRLNRAQLSAELHGQRARHDDSARPVVRRAVVLTAVGLAGLGATYLSQRHGGIEPWQAQVGPIGMLVTTIALFAAVGSWAPLALGLVGRALRGSGGAARLAISNLVSQPRRTGVIAVAVGASVGLACVLSSLIPAIRTTVAATYGAAAGERVVVTTLPLNNSGSIEAGISPAVLERLAAVPGVAAVQRDADIRLADAEGTVDVVAGDDSAPMPFAVVSGRADQDALRRGEVIVGTAVARSRHLRPGSMVRLPKVGGFVEFRVAGIWASPNDNGLTVMMSLAQLEKHWGRPSAKGVYVVPAAGVTPEELERRIEAAQLDPDLYALTPSQVADQLADEVGNQVGPFWALQRAMLLVALVATVSTLLLVGVQRKRELGILGAVGLGPAGLARMTVTEALAAAAAGAVLGALASVAMLSAVLNISVVAIGIRPAFRFDWIAVPAYGLVAAAVALVGASVPAWRTSRLEIVEALAYE